MTGALIAKAAVTREAATLPSPHGAPGAVEMPIDCFTDHEIGDDGSVRWDGDRAFAWREFSGWLAGGSTKTL
jgi:hypothetical protein